MRNDREHPLYYLDAETLLVATYVWVDDTLKALQSEGIRLPKPQRHQKATLSELLTIALFLTFLGLDLSKGYLLAQSLLRSYFPSLPHLSRFTRVLQGAAHLLAHLAVALAQRPSHVHVVDLKPIPLAHGHRIRGYGLPHSGVGVGPLGGFAGYALVGVMNDWGLFHRWAILPGNARETWAGELAEGLGLVLGDRGFRWVEGVVTPPYRTRGGKVVSTGWKGWMGKVRNWIETRFSVMVRSLGLHRLAPRSYWGLVARVNLILLAHNLIRSHVLLQMAGVEL